MVHHLALHPLGWGVLAGIGGIWLVSRSGGRLKSMAATVAGATSTVLGKGASLLKRRQEKSASKGPAGEEAKSAATATI